MLRDYQRECKESVLDSLQHHQRVMLSLPTGTGKTKTALSIAENKKFLFIVHRDFLATQSAQAFNKPIAIRTGKHKKGDLALNCIVTMQWLQAKNNLEKLPTDYELIIVDEAHHAIADSWQATINKLLEANISAKLLGMTATLQRPDKKPLSAVFEHLAYFKPINYFVEKGWLAPVTAHAFECDIDTSRLSVSRSSGDYVANNQLLAAVQVSNWREVILQAWQEHASSKKTIAFCASVNHSLQLAKAFNDNGIVAAHIDAETPQIERDRIEHGFRTGAITVLCNVAIYTEGYDVPDAECAIMARPVRSQLYYMQCVGRVLRPAPNKHAIVLDMTDSRHTLVQFGDLDPAQTFKSTRDLLAVKGYSGAFFDGFVLSLNQRLGLLQFERGYDVYAHAISLLRNNKLAWGVFGERALLQTGNGEFLVLPAKDVSGCTSDYRCILYKPNQIKVLGDSDALAILERAVDYAEQYATQLSDATAQWRFDAPSQNQISTLTERFKLSREAMEGVSKGQASLLISYLIVCGALKMPIGGEYQAMQDKNKADEKQKLVNDYKKLLAGELTFDALDWQVELVETAKHIPAITNKFHIEFIQSNIKKMAEYERNMHWSYRQRLILDEIKESLSCLAS